jgi:hypothetical protein
MNNGYELLIVQLICPSIRFHWHFFGYVDLGLTVMTPLI